MAGEGPGIGQVENLVFILRAMERYHMVLNRRMMIRFVYKRLFWPSEDYQLSRRVGTMDLRSVRTQFHGPNKGR